MFSLLKHYADIMSGLCGNLGLEGSAWEIENWIFRARKKKDKR
jgi:hypothetical protein